MKRLLYFIIFFELVIFLFNLLTYFGGFTGDPLIHARFAEMATQGLWFRFNAAEISSGVTSFLWMLLGTSGWLIGGIKGCLQIYKGVILISWLGSAGLLGMLVYRWSKIKVYAVLTSAVFLGYPGIALNGLTGMENMTFFFFVVLFLLVYSKYADNDQKSSGKSLLAIFLGIILGLQIITRPEGVVIALGFFVIEIWRMFNTKYPREQQSILKNFFLVVACSFLIVIPVYGFHFFMTGNLIPGSGVARMMGARRLMTSFHIFGPIWLYTRTLIRLVSYLPLFLTLGTTAHFMFRRNKNSNVQGNILISQNPSLRLAFFIAVLGIGLYTFVTGALHVNRYTIWIIGILTAIFIATLSKIFQTYSNNKSKLLISGILAGIIWIFAAQIGEGIFRYLRQDYIKLADVKSVVHAVDNRREQTNNLLSQISNNSDFFHEEPVGILLQEVQIRLFFDERINIFSRDGIISHLDFKEGGCPDYSTLLNNSKINIIMDNLNEGTTKGCIDDKEIFDLVRLYNSNQSIETENWKRIWYEDYLKIVFWYQLKQDENKMPILIRKSKQKNLAPEIQ